MAHTDTKWARRHRARLRFGLGSLLVLALIIYVAVRLYEPPTCYDRKENQKEVGVDCGGPCNVFCGSEVEQMKIAWAKSFEISPGWWSAMAYVENPNFDKQSEYISYTFSLFDANDQLILERSGSTYVYRELIVPVFEARIDVGDKVPVRTTFQWTTSPRWWKAPEVYRVSTEEQETNHTPFGEEVLVTVVNHRSIPLNDVEIVVVVYDRQDEVMASTQSYIETLGVRAKEKVRFVWPQRFPREVGRLEFLPRVPVQDE